MKLEKREITLNEADSLKDVYYLEKNLFAKYAEGKKILVRKEACNEIEKLIKQAEEEEKKALALWQRSKSEQI